MIRLFVDDIRDAPEGWTHALTYEEALWYLRNYVGNIEAVSLDHDLGYEDDGPTGMDILYRMHIENLWVPHIIIHSMNPVGRERMLWYVRSNAPEGTTLTEHIGSTSNIKIYRFGNEAG